MEAEEMLYLAKDGHRLTKTFSMIRLYGVVAIMWACLCCPATTFHCPVLECSCFYNGLETVKIACPPEHSGMRYTITHHIPASELTFNCLEPITYGPAMLKKFNFTQRINNVRFERCPLPINVTFQEILLGLSPRMLRFSTEMPQGRLDVSLFSNLVKLETLELDNNGFEAVDDFKSFRRRRRHPGAMIDDFSRSKFGLDEENVEVYLASLVTLSMTDNHLTRVPWAFLKAAPTLHSLTLGHNMLRLLAYDDLDGVPDLQILKLDNNEIESIHTRAFATLPGLKLLSLANNRLGNLPNLVFENLTHLQVLDLSGNYLHNIPAQLLSDTERLKTLRLSHNRRLSSLAKDFLSNTPDLEELDLSHNNFTMIDDNFFQFQTQLYKLSLAYNVITYLPQTLLTNTTKLISLDLSENRIAYIPEDFFYYLGNLEELHMSGNLLKSLKDYTLVGLTRLRHLHLPFNLLEDVSANALESCVNLISLDLSHNYLSSSIESISFKLPDTLQYLNLSTNLLMALSLGWTRGGDLRQLNVSYNQIKYVEADVGQFLERPLLIDLRYNLITTVYIVDAASATQPTITTRNRLLDSAEDDSLNGTFPVGRIPVASVPQQRLKDTMMVLVDDNPLICDCNLQSFVSHIRKSSNETSLQVNKALLLVCAAPPDVRDHLLVSLTSTDLICPVVDQCPPECHCEQRADQPGAVHVDCQSRSFVSFPERAPFNATVLRLEENALTSLKGLKESSWSQLTELHLTGNMISRIDAEEVILPKKLHTLRIDHNRLEYLPEGILHQMDAGNVTVIALAFNPWKCDCQNLIFQQWFLKNRHRVVDAERVTCRVKRQSKHGDDGVQVPLMNTVLVNCQPHKAGNKYEVILAAVLVLVLSTLLFLGTKLLMRNYFQIKLYLLRTVDCRSKRQTGKSRCKSVGGESSA